MAASYPNGVKTFVEKVDNQDPVIASDVNLVYEEVTAIETVLGTTPATSLGWSGSFTQGTTSWNNVASRLQNIEYGLNVSYNQRVDTSGGSTVSNSGSVVGLKFTPASGATGNLVDFNNSSGTAITSIGKDGYILVIDGGTP
jgi:hypothetical protein